MTTRTRTAQQRAAEGRVFIALGELKEPWMDFCKSNEVSASEGIKRAVHRLLYGVPDGERFRMMPTIEAKARVELRLKESELAAARVRAEEEGYASANLWMVAALRAALTEKPQFGKAEIDALGASNTQLVRIGRNLNQIARRLNSAQDAVEVRAREAAVVRDLVAYINVHVEKVKLMLRASIHRWGLAREADQ